MSLFLSLFNQVFIPRPDPQSLIYPSPATAAPANQTNDKLVRSGLTLPADAKRPLRRLVLCIRVNCAFPRLSPSTPKEFSYVHRPTRQNPSYAAMQS